MNEEKKNSWGNHKRTGIISSTIAGLLAFYAFTTSRNLFADRAGMVFVIIAGIIAIFGTIDAVIGKNRTGLGLNIVAWILVVLAYISWSARMHL